MDVPLFIGDEKYPTSNFVKSTSKSAWGVGVWVGGGVLRQSSDLANYPYPVALKLCLASRLMIYAVTLTHSLLTPMASSFQP